MSDGNMTRRLILTLPLAYSRFNEITQNGKKLQMRPNGLGLTLVNVEDFSTPVVSSYRLPLVLNVVIGMAILVLILLAGSKHRR